LDGSLAGSRLADRGRGSCGGKAQDAIRAVAPADWRPTRTRHFAGIGAICPHL